MNADTAIFVALELAAVLGMALLVVTVLALGSLGVDAADEASLMSSSESPREYGDFGTR